MKITELVKICATQVSKAQAPLVRLVVDFLSITVHEKLTGQLWIIVDFAQLSVCCVTNPQLIKTSGD